MTHPEDLLAGYIDGALSQSERMLVQEHLAGCDRCRDEVDIAGLARTKLAALADEPAPPQISEAVRRAMAGAPPAETVAGRVPARYRVLTALAAAAVVALIAVTLPHLGRSSTTGTNQLAQGDGTAQSTGNQGSGPQVAGAALPLEIQSIDYTAATAAKLVQRSPAPSPVEASDGAFGGGKASFGTPVDGQAALSCLQTAFRGIPGDPVRLIKATFQGQPAYIGVFTEGPGAGLPADTVTVRVASVTGCSVLTFASFKL